MIIYIVVDVTNHYNLACFNSLKKAEAMVKEYQEQFPNRVFTIEKHGFKK